MAESTFFLVLFLVIAFISIGFYDIQPVLNFLIKSSISVITSTDSKQGETLLQTRENWLVASDAGFFRVWSLLEQLFHHNEVFAELHNAAYAHNIVSHSDFQRNRHINKPFTYVMSYESQGWIDVTHIASGARVVLLKDYLYRYIMLLRKIFTSHCLCHRENTVSANINFHFKLIILWNIIYMYMYIYNLYQWQRKLTPLCSMFYSSIYKVLHSYQITATVSKLSIFSVVLIY